MNDIILDDSVLDVDSWLPPEAIEQFVDIIKEVAIMNEFVLIENRETGIETYTEINENIWEATINGIDYYQVFDDTDKRTCYVRKNDYFHHVYKKVKMDGKTRLVRAPHLKHYITNFAEVGELPFE